MKVNGGGIYIGVRANNIFLYSSKVHNNTAILNGGGIYIE